MTEGENGEATAARDRIEITHVPEPVAREGEGRSCASKAWWAFSRLCTLLVPDAYFSWRGVTDESKRQARREKWTICLVMLLFDAAFVGAGGLAPMLLCDDVDNLTEDDKSFRLVIPKDDIHCELLNFAMYVIMAVLSAVLIIQCLCSLAYVVRLRRTITRDDTRNKVIVMVPCYNEGERELRKTIDSVVDTTYPDSNKVLLVIADGNITGKGESMSTPEFLAEILGYNIDGAIGTFGCTSIGDRTTNRARLYSGTYDDHKGKKLKYVVIVKCGTQEERGSPRAGNRGKRDSQLLLAGLLNRFYHGRDLNALDDAIRTVLETLEAPLEEIKYLMAIDADTRVHRDSVSHMVYSMNQDEKILALCGETKIDNKSESWVTMIQVFEYYTNHHMKKAFESVFGCVTCLPGCFTMYRLFSDDNRPLLSCDQVYQRYATSKVETLHDKNLFHLGEDRMLTTLLLRAFPGMKLSFVPEATCYTIVPDTFAVLLSQRRRWINSTFHNMLELLRDAKMATVCCVSMKFLVVLDLVATLILPASLLYLLVNAYLTFAAGEPTSTVVLIALGISVGVQVLVFVLRSRWDYWWWFLVFVVAGVPVFYFVLPLYSFWNMDDFSWGATRLVADGPSPVDPAPDVDDGADTSIGPREEGVKVAGSGGGSVTSATAASEDEATPVAAAATGMETADGGGDPERGLPPRVRVSPAFTPPSHLDEARGDGRPCRPEDGSRRGFRFRVAELANIERYLFTNDSNSRLAAEEDASGPARGEVPGRGNNIRDNRYPSARSLLQRANARLASRSQGGQERNVAKEARVQRVVTIAGEDQIQPSTRTLLQQANARLALRSQGRQGTRQ